MDKLLTLEEEEFGSGSPVQSALNKHPQLLGTAGLWLPAEEESKTNSAAFQTHKRSLKEAAVSHRQRRIIKGQDEPEGLIYGRAHKFSPSSSKHPLRDHVAGGADLVVDSGVEANALKPKEIRSLACLTEDKPELPVFLTASRVVMLTKGWRQPSPVVGELHSHLDEGVRTQPVLLGKLLAKPLEVEHVHVKIIDQTIGNSTQ